MAMASKMIYDAVQSMDGCFGAVTCAVFVQLVSWRAVSTAWRDGELGRVLLKVTVPGGCRKPIRRLERNGNPGLPPWLPPWLPPPPDEADTGTGISGHHCLLPGLGWAGRVSQ